MDCHTGRDREGNSGARSLEVAPTTSFEFTPCTADRTFPALVLLVLPALPAGIWDYQWCTEMLPEEMYFTQDGEFGAETVVCFSSSFALSALARMHPTPVITVVWNNLAALPQQHHLHHAHRCHQSINHR